MAPGVDVLVVVVGSLTSSNSNRLRELAQRLGTDAYMVDSPEDLQASWFEGKRRVGLTAGASAPDILVQQVIERLRTPARPGGRVSAQRAGRGGDHQLSLAQGLGGQVDGV